MIADLFMGIASLIINIFTQVSSVVTLPTWFSDGITFIFSGSGIANNFLPVYPHPEMSGLVHSIGIMNIVLFLVGVLEIAIVVGIFIFILYQLIKILPWNTQG